MYVTGLVKSCAVSDAGDRLAPVCAIVGARAVSGVAQGTVTDMVRVASSMVPTFEGIVNKNPVMLFALLFDVSMDGSEQAQKKRTTIADRSTAASSRALCFLIM